ncbi:hypothetical protein AVEN_45383-1 [Araneus ventricosus]|uniref:CCHC-type domain-containing protein n=1 Tax=Araneus ventricosus TaxID=182803 RepID=A0A4Y2WD97_ARAVE|nr:hypothetical protein AVEN_45383-1 [Araneus ventricosus]
MDKMRYGSLDDFKEGAKHSKSGLPGKQGSKQVLHSPGPTAQPYVFGQRNPFELQPLGVAPPVGAKAVTRSSTTGAYVGFGLSLGLPPGTKWGDTPYPGVDGDDEGSKVVVPTDHLPDDTSDVDCPPVTDVEDRVIPPVEAMDEDPKAGHKRKKDKGKRRKQKLSRGRTEGFIDTSLLDRSSTDSDKTIKSSPGIVLVPDTPVEESSETDTSSGLIPNTPSRVQPPGTCYERLCPEMQVAVDTFVDKYPGNDNLVANIWILLSAIDVQFVGLLKRLEAIEGKVADSAVPPSQSYAQVVGQPRPNVRDIGTDPPQLLGVSSPSRVPKRKTRRGPPTRTEGVKISPGTDDPSHVLKQGIPIAVQGSGNTGRTAAPSLDVLQEGVAPQLITTPQPPKLPSRQLLHALVVTPSGEDIASSEQLQALLASSIHLKSIGVEVLGCSPAANKGVLVRVRTPGMVSVLEQAINTHDHLRAVCVARRPLRRSPRIMIYDVPVSDMVRETEEADFLQKLRFSNSIPDSLDIRVLFRKPGRGPFQHWVLSVAPELFRTLKGTNRLFFGFGTFKFREYLEPTQCFKCLRFGHLRATCSALKDRCTKCSGDHSFRVCMAASATCSRCLEYNRRRGTGPKVRTDHSAISVRCPVYLRERDEMGRHYDVHSLPTLLSCPANLLVLEELVSRVSGLACCWSPEEETVSLVQEVGEGLGNPYRLRCCYDGLRGRR